MDLELTGKRAFVTGGSRGIGKAIARVLAQEGARGAAGPQPANTRDHIPPAQFAAAHQSEIK